jgi:hypothetical protein
MQSLRETYNTAKYEEVMERINGRLGPEYDIDRSATDEFAHTKAAYVIVYASATAAPASAVAVQQVSVYW